MSLQLYFIHEKLEENTKLGKDEKIDPLRVFGALQLRINNLIEIEGNTRKRRQVTQNVVMAFDSTNTRPEV